MSRSAVSDRGMQTQIQALAQWLVPCTDSDNASVWRAAGNPLHPGDVYFPLVNGAGCGVIMQ